MTESQLERRVTQWCKSRNLLTYKFVSPNNRGVPDRLVIAKGRVLFLELKQPGKKPTKLQEHEMARLRAAGCWVYWVDNWPDAELVLRTTHEVNA